MRFVDTNILIYAVSLNPEEQQKQIVAKGLLEEDDIALSVQVLQEFYAQATRVSRPFALSRNVAAQFIESFVMLPVTAMTVAILQAAIAISTRFQLSYWDGAILAAAQSMGCDSVLSEDLSSH